MANKKRILTGIRVTGNLHIGHFFGAVQNWIKLQHEFETFLILSDWQVLYDHLEDEKGKSIEKNIVEATIDLISAGIDPNKTKIFIQSQIPELAELTMIFQFLVTVARAKRNPTIKSEMANCGFSDKEFDKINVGFLAFPISQAADILLPKANLVPVGEDQMAHIEQTREIARKFNQLYGETFPMPEGLVSATPRIVGLDGNAKMSKSLGNVIMLKATEEEVVDIVKKANTGPECALFDYEKMIDPKIDIEKLKKDHRNNQIRFSNYKPYLAQKINEFLRPMREKRKELESDISKVVAILEEGRNAYQRIAKETMKDVKEKMKMNYFIK